MVLLKNKYIYDIKDIIGKGGFGIVYKGYDNEEKKKIAIKESISAKYLDT